MHFAALALFAFAATATGCTYEVQELSYDPSLGHDGTFFLYEPKSDTARLDRPAVLAIHGAGDSDVNVANGDRLAAALRAKGADTEFIRLEGKEGNCHSDCWKVPRAREALHRFLARTIGT
jgi:dipeptidyl aminopeptidase/acylaminoacyl peptidase